MRLFSYIFTPLVGAHSGVSNLAGGDENGNNYRRYCDAAIRSLTDIIVTGKFLQVALLINQSETQHLQQDGERAAEEGGAFSYIFTPLVGAHSGVSNLAGGDENGNNYRRY